MNDNRKILTVATMVAAILALSGCAAGGGSMKTDVAKEFSMEQVHSIHAGMTEAQVVDILGKPLSFKVDEKGERYLNYAILKTSTTFAGSATPLANGARASNSDTGLTVIVKLKGGLVKSVAYSVYNEEQQ